MLQILCNAENSASLRHVFVYLVTNETWSRRNTKQMEIYTIYTNIYWICQMAAITMSVKASWFRVKKI